ncbi:MAG TPA: 2-oxo acid dehydrogenase subunit E2 [Blastocatellia bacterium]|nr:2-oxo acid dehydrogenase subunit E2 [Blastocatellia bacterium]
MATELKLPQLGENIESGVLAKLLVSVGDKVERDQPVIELETDKATVEVPAFESGVVKEIRVKEGDTIKVGQTILTLEDGAATKQEKAKPDTKPEQRIEEKAEAQEAKPQEAKPQEAGQQEAPQAAPAKAEQKPEPEKKDEEVAPQSKPSQAAAAAPAPAPSAAAAEPEQKRGPVPASPSVRRMARELGVDIYEVEGTGPGARISAEDVSQHARSLITGLKSTAAAAPGGLAAPAVKLPDFSQWGEVERKPMSGIRRKTAETMRNAWLTVPHVTQHDLADITDLEALRKRFGRVAEEAGGKLTVTSIALKVVAAALKVFPQFNASIDVVANEIVYKKYYHIGVAVDTDRGLLVPVIRDVDKKNIRDLSAELNQLAEKARNKKISLEEMQGASITITNLGGIGGTSFTPIVNAPEVAILGLSRASHQPVYREGNFEPRLMLPLSLSYDHRLIDGADAARFVRWVAEALEQPFVLALQG